MAESAGHCVDVSAIDGGSIVRVSLCRPPANAFDLAFYEELGGCLAVLASTPPLPACVQLRSSVERFFCGGRDIKEPSPLDEAGWRHRHAVVGALYRQLYEFPAPVIALVDGYALGTGCVIASLCDIRLATERSQFGLPEVRAGSVGGTRNLMRLLPQGIVRRMALTSQPMSAARAFQLGFVDEVVAAAELEEAGNTLARTIAGFDPEIVQTIKRTMNQVEAMSFWDGYEEEQRQARERAGRIRDEDPPDATR
jgi:enoyl-CoA hydratase